MGNRYTSDLVAGVNMTTIGIQIERSAGAGFGDVVGEDGNGGTESRRRRSARGWWTMRQPAGGAKLSEEAKRRPGKPPAVVLLLLRRLSIKVLLLSVLSGLQGIAELDHGLPVRR